MGEVDLRRVNVSVIRTKLPPKPVEEPATDEKGEGEADKEEPATDESVEKEAVEPAVELPKDDEGGTAGTADPSEGKTEASKRKSGFGLATGAKGLGAGGLSAAVKTTTAVGSVATTAVSTTVNATTSAVATTASVTTSAVKSGVDVCASVASKVKNAIPMPTLAKTAYLDTILLQNMCASAREAVSNHPRRGPQA